MRKLLNKLNFSKESGFVFWCIIIVLVVTTLPYLYGLFTAPAGSVYTGIHHLTPGDTNVYYSYIEQVKQGNILFQDLFTSESQTNNLFKPFWLVVGVFASLFHLPNVLAMQLARLILIPIFIVVLYKLLQYFFPEVKTRRLALVFLLFSSGLGGVLAPVLEPYKYIAGQGAYYHWPMDLWVPESNTFMTMYHLPHLIFSSILIVLSFLFFMRSILKNKSFYAWLAGACSLVLMLFHPFHVITVWLIPFVWLIISILVSQKINWSRLKQYLIFILVSLPGLLYQLAFQLNDYLAQGRAEQNILITPRPWLVLISYGFLLVFAVVGATAVLRRFDLKKLFLVVWAVAQLALIFAPIFFQRRLSQGLHLPLAILACLGVIFVWQKIKKYFSKYISDLLFIKLFLFASVFFPFFAGSTIYVLANDISLYHGKNYPVFYLTEDINNSFNWIQENTNPNDVFLTGALSGNFIPGWTGRKVYVGHGVETIDYLNKKNTAEFFFSDQEWDRKAFLQQEGIDYLFVSSWPQKEEKDLWPADSELYLKLVFFSDQVRIYQIVD